jgi:hypothetical protein
MLATAATLLTMAAPLSAHRLDEYLQATLLSVEKDRLQVSLRMIPGVAVAPAVIWSIDTDRDGLLSEAERQTYARRVLGDLSLRIDGRALQPRLVSVTFPNTAEMEEGLGEIHIEFTADLPRGSGDRKLVLENHHQSRISAYLVNVLAHPDKDIRIAAQTRNRNQSLYELDYVQTGGPPDLLSIEWLSGICASLLFARLAFALLRT